MIVQKFVVSDMQEGLSTIRRALGREAVILSQRRIRGKGPSGWLKKKQIEVYAAAEEPAKTETVHRVPEPAAAAKTDQDVQKRLDELTELISRLQPAAEKPADIAADTDRASAAGYLLPKAPAAAAPEPIRSTSDDLPVRLQELKEQLLALDVHPRVAAELIGQTARILARYPEQPEQVLADLILEKLGGAASLDLPKYRQTCVMLVGPAGAGKTTTLLKLAARYSQEQPLRVGLISADFQRAGAHEQLKAYARILKLPLVCLQSLAEAREARETLTDCDLVLVDTPGCSPSFPEQTRQTRQLLEVFNPDQVFACLPACTSFLSAERIFSMYRGREDLKLIITKVDELAANGPILNLAHLSQNPIAYLTDGQPISGHLHQADCRAIMKQLLR